MNHPVITIEDPSRPQPGRTPSWLQRRWLLLAGGLALAELLAYFIVEPNRWFAILLVGSVLAACIALYSRVPPGNPRDLMLVVGIAQGLVIGLPVLLGVVTLVVATVTVLLLIALFVFIGLRLRR